MSYVLVGLVCLAIGIMIGVVIADERDPLDPTEPPDDGERAPRRHFGLGGSSHGC